MPTRKQRTEQDARQRKRLRKVITKHIAEMGAKSFGDSMARLKAIPDSEWKATVAQDELATQKAKGPGKGWHGPPKGTHGKGSPSGGAGAGEMIAGDEVTPEQLRSWNRQIAKWEGARQDMAIGAMGTVMDLEGGASMYTIEQGGQLKGIAAVAHPGSESSGAKVYESSMYLEYLATGERGYGYPMMRGLAEQAQSRGLGLAWYAVPTAQGFYEKIGFTPSKAQPWGGADFNVTNDELARWLERGVTVQASDAELLAEIADAEPGDGAFAMPKDQAQELATQAAKGPGKGWHGPPRGTHGKTLGKIPGHVWERASQRTGYKAVREAIKTLRSQPLLPPSRSQQWHMPLKVGGQLRGYLVGSDSFAQTVLGASMVPKKGSVEVTT